MSADNDRRPDVPPAGPVLDPANPPEFRALTTEEFKQLDTMLGGTDFPTLIRPTDAPAPARPPAAGLLQTVVVAIILAAIVALALYLFR